MLVVGSEAAGLACALAVKQASFQPLVVEKQIWSAARAPCRGNACGFLTSLKAGRFEHNQEMHEKFLPNPSSGEWAQGSPGNTGDTIQAAVNIGAKLALMSKA
ncbi:MAG: hypothetical protein QXQ70_08810 [Candidatus Caldarchaeum sp.]